jgi:hypothetical protein|mmetsp:Transcript_27822/g.72011  ORF Transcript_27822/g.72011 Transcript_27822/m.72011 type:complete len:127 (+) Transcript_27822:37-417(+)
MPPRQHHRQRVSNTQNLPAVQKELRKHAQESEALARTVKYEQLKRKRKPVVVQVQILTGRRISLTIDIDDRVADVKEKIRIKEGIDPDQQSLLFNGVMWMDAETTVQDNFIQGGDTLYLVLRNRGG